jgi:hypothetical protein
MPSIDQNSGSINVDCDQWGTAQVVIQLPAGAVITNHFAHWSDLAAIKESAIDAIQQAGNAISVTGRIRGIDADYILGVRECHSGGHGTLVFHVDYNLP